MYKETSWEEVINSVSDVRYMPPIWLEYWNKVRESSVIFYWFVAPAYLGEVLLHSFQLVSLYIFLGCDMGSTFSPIVSRSRDMILKKSHCCVVTGITTHPASWLCIWDRVELLCWAYTGFESEWVFDLFESVSEQRSFWHPGVFWLVITFPFNEE